MTLDESHATEYTVSIRITLPEDMRAILKKEKERFVAEYKSSYESEPHITLYLARYTEEGFPKLITNLQDLALTTFTFSLLEPRMIPEEHRNFYCLDVSNQEQLRELHEKISTVASRYQSPLLREKDRKRQEQGISPRQWFPHITLGEVANDAPQPDLATIQENIASVAGAQVTVSDIVVLFYKKEPDEEKATLIEEVRILMQ